MNRKISIVTLMGLLFFGISVPTAISAESTPSPSVVPASTARAATPTPSLSAADKAAADKLAAAKAATDKLAAAKAAADKLAAAKAATDKLAAAKAAADKAAADKAAKAAADKAAADKLAAAKAAADKAAADKLAVDKLAATKASADKAAAAKAAADKAASQSCVGCTVGKVGPGGGIIFYDAGSRQKWGRYLEAAPANWSGSGTDPKAIWCNILNASLNSNGNKVLGVTIGSGRSNTHLMSSHCSSGAGVLASAYRGGGKSDWFLPSKDELNMMYANRALIGGLAPDNYWSSSEDYALASWFQSIVDGSTGSVMKYTTDSVRPIRAL